MSYALIESFSVNRMKQMLREIQNLIQIKMVRREFFNVEVVFILIIYVVNKSNMDSDQPERRRDSSIKKILSNQPLEKPEYVGK